jgi:hypothetical protein
MFKKIILGFIVAVVILLGWEGFLYYKNNNNLSQIITYLVSTSDSTKYCNGADMDSVGYQATITQERTTSTPSFAPTMNEIIKTVLNSATTGMSRSS